METVNNTLTVEQKLEVVKKAIEILKSHENDFMCTAIELATSRLYCDEPFFNKKLKGYELIPEIIDFKPADKKINSAWWFPNESNRQIRIDVLDIVIVDLNNIK